MDAARKIIIRANICCRRSVLRAAAAGALAALLPKLSIAYIAAPSKGPVVLAMSDFVPFTADDGETARNITQLVIGDLSRTGRFTLIDSAAAGGKIADSNTVPQFADWRALNAQGLVTGRIGMDGQRLKSEVRVWDVVDGQLWYGSQYFSTPQEWRKAAYVIADSVYKRFTGEASRFAD
jgi:TolB protein